MSKKERSIMKKVIVITLISCLAFSYENLDIPSGLP
ncbi:MAG: hypothetical protein ACI82Q_001735, partial [Nonlabens sp.]